MASEFEACTDTLRKQSRPFYRLWSVAPALAQPKLAAYLALICELQRIPDLVKEPLMGDIRFAWWREAFDDLKAGTIRQHPVLQAIAKAGFDTDSMSSIEAIIHHSEEMWQRDSTDALDLIDSIEKSAALRFGPLATLLGHGGDDHPTAAAAIGRSFMLTALLVALRAETPAEASTNSTQHQLIERIQSANARFNASEAATRRALRPLLVVLAGQGAKLAGRMPSPLFEPVDAFWRLVRARA